MLAGTGLRYEVAGRTVLDAVDVQAGAGRLLAVCGPSGAGKSSLLALLGGLLAPSAGSVSLAGGPVRVGDAAVRRRIAIVLQGYGLATALTARENVAIVLQTRGRSREEVRDRSAAALDAVGLTEVADHLIEDMSGGQQQRVAVARALAAAPEVLLADEPTSELDAENRERVIDRLAELARAGSIIVIASHDPDVVERCDDVLELDAGKVVAA
ncbi:MAG TPA: ATP-binding cassette domain-containing protein [Jatrophihabitans sp.]|jgi:ABC-type multidrug transport system ATPase subunit|nr:ATP-binding cassette domain-containing protein [Jatrophihabitans sp.]